MKKIFLFVLLMLICSTSFASFRPAIPGVDYYEPAAAGTGGWTTDSSSKTTTTFNVGVGTTLPEAGLDVSGTIKADDIYVPTGGNIGVGTLIPTAELEVVGTIKASNYAVTSVDATAGSIFSPNGIVIDPNNATGQSLVPKFSMTTTGNTGIGTVTPNNFLSIGSTGQTNFDSGGNLSIGSTVAPNTLYVLGTVGTSGNVGIGTLSAAENLHVEGTAKITGTTTLASIAGSTQCLHVNSSGVVSGTGSDCGAGGGGGYFVQTAVGIGTTSNVGVGTTVPGAKLDVAGSMQGSSNLTLGSYGSISFAGSLNGYFNGGNGSVTTQTISSNDGSGITMKGRDASSGSTGSVTIRGGDGNSSTGSANSLTLRGGDASQSGTTGTGSATLRGGDQTHSTNTIAAGNLTIRSGGSSNGTTGKNGKLSIGQTFKAVAGNFTALNNIACLSADNTIGDCPTSATNQLGVGIGTTAPGIVQFAGVVEQVPFDGTYTPSAGWYACTSATTAGAVLPQSTACAAGRQVGIITQGATSVGVGTFMVQIK